MRKLKKAFILSVSLLVMNLTSLSSYSDTDYNRSKFEPKQITELAQSYLIDNYELYKLQQYPLYSPIDPSEVTRISSHFGSRIHPTKHIRSFHTGIDLAATKGTPVRATSNGIVTISKKKRGYGNIIEVTNNIHSSRYAHLNYRISQLNDTVCVGDTIGYVGSTGVSTGPHLHYEIRINNIPINPLDMYPKQVTEKNYMSYFNVINKLIDYSDKCQPISDEQAIRINQTK